MQKSRTLFLITFLFVFSTLCLTRPQPVYAGIYNANTEVTYKEYWIPHAQFTGGFVDNDKTTCIDSSSGNSWYLEPWPCPKTLKFTLADDFSQALKVEIFLDLWRNHDSFSARFQLNGHNTTFTPNVGYEWGRSPYITEIPKEFLVQGENTITLWQKAGGYHVHDIAFRIYFDDAHPLLDNTGALVVAPVGELLTVGGLAAQTGGVVNVDSDQLLLTATTSTIAKFLEFHAFYDGYDEDSDGIFRDWHNLTRNNWNSGGISEKQLGGTVNHIGTKAAPTPGDYSITWNLPHVMNQAGVKFKLRIVNAQYVVREAAGGISGEFTLQRSKPMAAFIMANFKDKVLHHSTTSVAQYPDVFTQPFNLPVNPVAFTDVYLLGAFWENPNIAINNNTSFRAFDTGAGEDKWALSIRKKPASQFVTGANQITYSWTGGFGQFIEKPGPMVILKQTASQSDTTNPVLTQQNPAPNATKVDPGSSINLHLTDSGWGLDITSIKMFINNILVVPTIRGFSNDYALVYEPPTQLPSSSTTTVSIEACDLATNCVNKQYLFSTGSLDTTAPVIINALCIAGEDSVTVAWDTNEETVGRVDYGATVDYGEHADEAQMATSHVSHITGLATGALLHYQISATDASNNQTQTTDALCPPVGPSPLESDDFNACALNQDRWVYIDPQSSDAGVTQVTQTETALMLAVPGGIAHDVWSSGNRAPHLMQATTNSDFAIEVKFESSVTEKYQLQGILVEQDSTNLIRINFQNNGSGDSRFFVAKITENVPQTLLNLALPNGTGPLYMRVSRTALQWELFYSYDATDWVFATSFAHPLTVTSVGLFAGNAGPSPSHTAVIDYFFTDSAPIIHEDSKALYLTDIVVSPIGAGSASSKPVYPVSDAPGCGNPVQLTATANQGWTFDQWHSAKGSVAGTQNPLETTFAQGEAVTATFIQDQYILAANVVGGGSIQTTPLQATYVYSDEVTLIAVPSIGWSFVGWSGASTENTLTTTLTITGTTAVTATFVAEEYTLTVNTAGDGSGTTTVTPLQGTYLYSDVVTLSAEATPGSTFTGWSGAIASGQPTETVTINGDTVVTATFAEEVYTLDINVVTNNVDGSNTEAGGTVAVTPDKTLYGFNEKVSLVATAKPGWIFAGWSGATTDSVAAITLTMRQNESVIATFTQEQYTLTRNTDGQGTGSIKVTPDRVSYLFGDIVTVEAVADTGSLFAGWSDDLAGTVPTKTLTITDNSMVLATFDRVEYQVNVTVLGGQDGEVGGTVTISPDGPYYFDSKVTLTATPNTGYEFDRWSSTPGPDVSGAQIGADTDPVIDISVTENVLYFANFTKIVVVVNEPKIFIPFISR